jgi:5-methylcytosine-specific restriction endonuclease McrA
MDELRKYREAHRAEEYGRHRRFRATEHGKAAIAAVRHNQRSQMGDTGLTAAILQELKAERNGMCPYCGREIIDGHFDHVMPLSRGGSNVRENILWVCAQCNRQKHNKTLVDFLVGREEALALPARRSEAEKAIACP